MRSIRHALAIAAAALVSACGSPQEVDAASQATCGLCHGLPPSTGRHPIHESLTCWNCHADVATNTAVPGIANETLHDNGVVNVRLSVNGTWDENAKTCSNVACHATSAALSW